MNRNQLTVHNHRPAKDPHFRERPIEMVAVVTGSRKQLPGLEEAIAFQVDRLPASTVLFHGDNPNRFGADQIADRRARSRGLVVRPMPARWHAFGDTAGQRRNARMLNEAKKLAAFSGVPIVVLAFPRPNGTGTQGCCTIATSLKIPIKYWFEIGDHESDIARHEAVQRQQLEFWTGVALEGARRESNR